VAGVNGTGEPRDLKLDLSFVAPSLRGKLVGDAPGGDGFAQRTLGGEPAGDFPVTLAPRGGFLMRVEGR
jgi:hypothetical protein